MLRRIAPAAALASLLLASAASCHRHPKTSKQSDVVLKRFNFNMNRKELYAMFGTRTPNRGITADFAPKGVIRRVKISAFGYAYHNITMWAGEAFKPDAAAKRLEKLVPNRLKKSELANGASYKIECVKSSLALTLPLSGSAAHGGASIQVKNVVSAPAGPYAKQRTDAFWNLARYLAYGSAVPAPTPAELVLVNGKPLSAMAKLDLGTESSRVDSSYSFTGSPNSACNSGTVSNHASFPYCTFTVDDPLVSELKLRWQNAADDQHAKVQSASFSFNTISPKHKAAVAKLDACLEGAFGKSQKPGVWKIDRAGDTVSRKKDAIVVEAPSNQKPDKLPAWTKHFGALVKALDDCAH